MPSEALAGIAGSRGVEGAATARLQQPHAAPAQQQQKKDAGDESPDMGPGQTACPLLEGDRTYGRHSEIDAFDPERTRHRIVSSI